MVNRRNFFTISIIMFIVLFLFQFSNYAKDRYNDYTKNEYVVDAAGLLDRDDVVKVTKLGESGRSNRVVYIGDLDKDGAGRVVSQWCLYMKKSLQSFESAAELADCIQSEEAEIPELVVVGSGRVDWSMDQDIERLQSIVDAGSDIVLCELPKPWHVTLHPGLRTLLGIESVESDSVTVDGLKLYSGLLLGGETVYMAENEEEQKQQDMNLTFPWYRLAYGTKVYMKGIFQDDSVKSEDCPPVIWRKSFENGCVYAVNDDYMNSLAGLGLLTGMYCDTEEYSLYPVVNAQNMVAASFPGMADENGGIISEKYSQSLPGVYRDIIWPSIASIYQNNSMGLSCMLSPQYDYADGADPQAGSLEYYLKLINEEHAEAGLSGYTNSDTPVSEKLAADQTYVESEVEGYTFSSFYRDELSDSELGRALGTDALRDVRTVVENDEDLLSESLIGYETDSVTRQKIIVDGFSQTTYGTDFMVRSIETAIGYGSIAADMSRAAYPQSEEDQWEKLSKQFSVNVSTYWEKFDRFDATTVSDTDSRIRSFLGLDYKVQRTGDVIWLDTTGADDGCWFILRADNEKVDTVSGGTSTRLENGAWLIHVKKSHAEITMKSTDELIYK